MLSHYFCAKWVMFGDKHKIKWRIKTQVFVILQY